MPAHTTPKMSIGERIAAWRVYRGMTQEACAGLVGKSLSWWKKIEGGQRHVERLADIIAIAGILRVPDLADLTGVLEWSLSRDQMRPVPVLPDIREALLRLEVERSGGPASIAELSSRAVHARETFHRQKMFIYETGRQLPSLILDGTHAYRAADTATDRRTLAGILSEICLITSEVLRDAGDFPLAHLAIDRCHLYAREAEDPLRMAWATWDSSGVLKDLGRPEEGLAQCREIIPALERRAEADATDDVLSVLGEIYSQAALMHAHCGEEGMALSMMDRSADAYGRIGPGYRNPISTYTREGAYIMAAPIFTALGKSQQAVKAGDHLDIMQTPSRPAQAIWLVNVARGYSYRNEDAGTVLMLNRAYDASPELVGRSTHAREMVRSMLRRDRKTFSAEVRSLASNLNVLGS